MGIYKMIEWTVENAAFNCPDIDLEEMQYTLRISYDVARYVYKNAASLAKQELGYKFFYDRVYRLPIRLPSDHKIPDCVIELMIKEMKKHDSEKEDVEESSKGTEQYEAYYLELQPYEQSYL